MTEIEKQVTEIENKEIENYKLTIDELLEQVEALSARCNFAESRLQKYEGIEETLNQLESDYKALRKAAENLNKELTLANSRVENLDKILDDKQKGIMLATERAKAWKKVVELELFDE